MVFYVERSDHIDVWRVFHGRRDIPASMQELNQDLSMRHAVSTHCSFRPGLGAPPASVPFPIHLPHDRSRSACATQAPRARHVDLFLYGTVPTGVRAK
jgi:hypothetical protein